MSARVSQVIKKHSCEMAAPTPSAILIAPNPFGLPEFDVHAGVYSRDFTTREAAIAYATGLAVTHGWAIDDQSSTPVDFTFA